MKQAPPGKPATATVGKPSNQPGASANRPGTAPADPDRSSQVPLTPRERQVAALVASGRTNRQIGRVLGISEKTVEVHLHHVMSKLDARSRAEVAAWAVTHHLSAPA